MKNPSKWNRRFLLPFLLISLCFWNSCSGGSSQNNNNNTNFDNNAMLSDIAANFIVPLFLNFKNQSQNFSSELENLCTNVNQPNLDQAQISWKKTQLLLKVIESLRFGPFVDLDLDTALDFWPARMDNIEAAISNNASFDIALLNNLGVTVRGLPVAEYLIFDNELGDSAVLDSLNIDTNADRRCSLLTAVGKDILNNAQELYDAWNPSDGDYAGTFSQAGQGSSQFASSQSVVSILVNNLIATIESFKDMKLGKPLGKKNGGTPQPDDVESPFSDHSIENLASNLEGIQHLWEGSFGGKNGLGFKDLIRSKNTDLANTFSSTLAESLTLLKAIPAPLSSAVLNDPSSVEATFEKLRELRDLVRGPIASVLGVTTVFSDNDGD